nr:MAG TPA: hypothetical protein [Caudoviricetes sp.]
MCFSIQFYIASCTNLFCHFIANILSFINFQIVIKYIQATIPNSLVA